MNMAQAIRKISKEVPNKVEERAQASQEIMQELADNKDAVLAAIQIMKGMQDMGIYDALRGMMETELKLGR